MKLNATVEGALPVSISDIEALPAYGLTVSLSSYCYRGAPRSLNQILEVFLSAGSVNDRMFTAAAYRVCVQSKL